MKYIALLPILIALIFTLISPYNFSDKQIESLLNNTKEMILEARKFYFDYYIELVNKYEQKNNTK